ncbi:choline/ethanolamine kinase-like [Oppia nitens]|uniref:choline/ethanolamine kinase-like n=1 Tax=Oppia nitens TaxID=1686743 RepID=UPI0023DC7285|nr:choline/ethanolamine kinase-like [Oppia nitens]
MANTDNNNKSDITVELRSQLSELCKTYLKDGWTTVNENSLVIKPITDGFINKLYLCCLPDTCREPGVRKVIVRFEDYEEFKDMGRSQINAITINIILAANNISPKVLGVFPSGTIIEYIENRYLSQSDYTNTNIIELLAQKLAKIHSLNIPIAKDSKTFTNVFRSFLDADENMKQSLKDGYIRQVINDLKLNVFQEMDFTDEFHWLLDVIDHLQSPVVFAHNDFNRRNTLICESKDNNNNDLNVYLIDFDWSSYGKRGVDFGQYFNCWGQEATDFGTGPFPSDQQMLPFIDAYIVEMSKLVGDDYPKLTVNSRERLLKEAKVCTLMAQIKDILYCIWDSNRNKTTELMVKGNTKLGDYLKLKAKLLTEFSNDLK